MNNKFFVPALFCIGLLANTFLISKALAAPMTIDQVKVFPVACMMNAADETPSCSITYRGIKGERIKVEFFMQKQSGDYEDSIVTPSINFQAEPEGFDINPVTTEYKQNGAKQIRLMYTGPRSALDTSKEIHGRLVISQEGSKQISEAYSLPVYFTTQPGQTYSALSGHFSVKDGKHILSVKNSGNGVFAVMKGVFDGKDVRMNANVLPQSTDQIVFCSPKIMDCASLINAKKVALYDKKTGKEVEVIIE